MMNCAWGHRVWLGRGGACTQHCLAAVWPGDGGCEGWLDGWVHRWSQGDPSQERDSVPGVALACCPARQLPSHGDCFLVFFSPVQNAVTKKKAKEPLAHNTSQIVYMLFVRPSNWSNCSLATWKQAWVEVGSRDWIQLSFLGVLYLIPWFFLQ